MKQFIMLWLLIGSCSIYAVYKGYQEKQAVLANLIRVEQMMLLKNNELQRYQEITEQMLKEKLKAENRSHELTRQLKDDLKNTQCTCETVPAAIVNKLYNRVYQIRQSAENSNILTH